MTEHYDVHCPRGVEYRALEYMKLPKTPWRPRWRMHGYSDNGVFGSTGGVARPPLRPGFRWRGQRSLARARLRRRLALGFHLVVGVYVAQVQGKVMKNRSLQVVQNVKFKFEWLESNT